MNISNGLSPTVNEESLNTNREPSTNKKGNLKKLSSMNHFFLFPVACKKLELENNNHANSMESEILDEEPEAEQVAMNINDDEQNSR